MNNPNIGGSTRLNSTNYSGTVTTAIQLDNNKIFMTYGKTYDLNCMIGTINETSISMSNDTHLMDDRTGTNNADMSITKLSNNKVFITYCGKYIPCYGMVCTIENNTIIKGTTIMLVNTSSSMSVKTVTLSDDKVFICYPGVNNTLQGILCTINDTNIINTTNIQLSDITDSGNNISLLKLSNNKILIGHNHKDNSNYYSAFRIVTITNNDIISLEITN